MTEIILDLSPIAFGLVEAGNSLPGSGNISRVVKAGAKCSTALCASALQAGVETHRATVSSRSDGRCDRLRLQAHGALSRKAPPTARWQLLPGAGYMEFQRIGDLSHGINGFVYYLVIFRALAVRTTFLKPPM